MRRYRQRKFAKACALFGLTFLLDRKHSPPKSTWLGLWKYAFNSNSRGPDFLVVGAQKCGTTAPAHFFCLHPEVCMGGPKKELHYFDSSRYPNHKEYHRCFAPEGGESVFGEATPSYMFVPKAMRRIHEYNPRLKLIVLLRDPIERTYSNWIMRKERVGDVETFDFDTFLRAHQTKEPWQDSLILDRSLYAGQLQRIFRYFPREQVLILLSEDLRSSHRESMNRIAAFLGISPLRKLRTRNGISVRPLTR